MSGSDDKYLTLSSCPVCHGSDRKKLYTLNLFTVFECGGCCLRYIDPCLSSQGMQDLYSSTENLVAINAFHASYYDYADPNMPSGTVREFERALDLAGELIQTTKRKIFDAGCGNGLFLAVAKRKGWDVSGCDPSANNVALAKNKLGLEVDGTDFLSFCSSGVKYDVISFWDVLEHLSDPHAFIRKAKEMLTSGGVILIGGPNDRSFLRILAEAIFYLSGGLVRGPLKKPYLLEHVTYYTAYSLQKLLDQHGFSLKRSFMSSTDLRKYRFSTLERIIAATVLSIGKCLGLQNRLIAVFQATG